MTPEEFVANCLKTESKDFDKIIPRLIDPKTIRLLHAGIGLITEGAEFLDALKKYIFYGKELDEVNLGEELGDSDWYQAIALNALGSSKEEIWEKVIAKLRSRYGDIFNEEGAVNRDLEKERKVLEDIRIYQPIGSPEEMGIGFQPEILAGNIPLDMLVHHSSFDASSLKYGSPQCKIVQASGGGTFKITTGNNVTCPQCKELMVSRHFDRMQ